LIKRGASKRGQVLNVELRFKIQDLTPFAAFAGGD